jgi:hypothetical protein
LLGWHLYNQLAAKVTPEQRDLVREQLAWLRSVSDKISTGKCSSRFRLAALPCIR